MAHLNPKHPSGPLSVRLAEASIKRLEALAQATGRTKSFLAAEAIDRYLEAESWQVQAIKEALRKADSPEAQFVSDDAVTKWLHSWGTEDEGNPPQ